MILERQNHSMAEDNHVVCATEKADHRKARDGDDD